MVRLPITGIGVLAPGAIGVEAFRKLLESGATALGEIDRFDTAGLRAHRAGLVRDFVAKDFIAPAKLRRMTTLSRYAVAAARLCLDDADLVLGQSTGVAIGTAFGPVQTSVDYMKEYVEKGAALAPPQLFAESVANAPGSHIAIEHNLRGFNVTFTQRESSALAAAMYGASQVAKKACDATLIGGVDEINEMLFSVLDRLGALAHDAGDGEVMRPFDAARNGLLPGEGSAFILASEFSNMRPVYAFLSGFGMAHDTTATVSDWGDGVSSVVAAMRAAIADADLAPGDIDAIYASANGSRRGDLLEARAIRALFGENVPPVVAVKGYAGEYAAGGMLQLIAAILAIRDGLLHPSTGFSVADAELGIEPQRQPERRRLNNVLVSSLSAGGGIVCAVVTREGD